MAKRKLDFAPRLLELVACIVKLGWLDEFENLFPDDLYPPLLFVFFRLTEVNLFLNGETEIALP
jgi:hypothetical protein